MQRTRRRLYFVLIVIVLLFLFSCHPTFYIKITDISDPSHPCFSISQSKVFPWAKGMWNTLEISEVDDKGNRIQPIWIIEPYQNVDIKKLCYGKVPAGYKELIKPIPIELDKFYLFYPSSMGAYFKISQNKDDIKVQIYTMSEFYEKIVNT